MTEVLVKWSAGLLDGAFEGEGQSWFRPDQEPGTSAWVRNTSGAICALEFICPCGCGRLCCVDVTQSEGGDQGWQWDGDLERPTLRPSIWCKVTCGWHGFLQRGVFRG